MVRLLTVRRSCLIWLLPADVVSLTSRASPWTLARESTPRLLILKETRNGNVDQDRECTAKSVVWIQFIVCAPIRRHHDRKYEYLSCISIQLQSISCVSNYSYKYFYIYASNMDIYMRYNYIIDNCNAIKMFSCIDTQGHTHAWQFSSLCAVCVFCSVFSLSHSIS